MDSIAASDLANVGPGGGVAPGCYHVEIFKTLATATPAWRALEATGLFSPYQRLDWLAHLHQAGADAGVQIAIALVQRNDEAVALLPLGLHRRRGLITARFLGTEQANTDWMLIAPGFAPDRSDLDTIFAAIAAAVGGIDLLSFQNQLPHWQGTPNPLLLLPHFRAASNLYTTTIGGTPLPYVESRMQAKKRGNLRRGRRRLEEAMGPVRLVRVADAPTLAQVHAVFLEQRRARFDAMGIANVFAQPLFVKLFIDATTDGFDNPHPVMCAHALMAGDEIVATTWGALTDNHYSLYINSTASGPAIRFSLMGILIADLMDELVASGVQTFDLGLGDFEYKTEWTEPTPVFNSLVPLTAKGRIAATAMSGTTAIKRTIKQNPRLWHAASQVRRLLFRLGGGARS